MCVCVCVCVCVFVSRSQDCVSLPGVGCLSHCVCCSILHVSVCAYPCTFVSLSLSVCLSLCACVSISVCECVPRSPCLCFSPSVCVCVCVLCKGKEGKICFAFLCFWSARSSKMKSAPLPGLQEEESFLMDCIPFPLFTPSHFRSCHGTVPRDQMRAQH